MVAARQFPASRPEFEDPLDYLPRKVLVETKKNQTIYNRRTRLPTYMRY
jgi:hypothetical protein